MKSASRDSIAALREELDAIHSNNVLYWKRGATNSREEKLEHKCRLNRPDEIRSDLACAVQAGLKKQSPRDENAQDPGIPSHGLEPPSSEVCSRSR
jgi:hypothetical protein